MALQPIYGKNGEVDDYYEDGLPPEETPPVSPQPETEAQPVQMLEPQGEQTEAKLHSPHSFSVPDLFKGTDLFIGTTIHQGEDHPQGPLISLFVRALPDGAVTVKTYRAAELSGQAFLDNLQKALAATMQVHLLTWAERQRKQVEEEAKRRARAREASTKAAQTTAPTSASTQTPTPAPPSAAQKAATSAAREASKKSEKYITVSMFD